MHCYAMPCNPVQCYDMIVFEQAPIYDENLAKIGPASPGEIIIMIAGRNYKYNFDRAENLIDYNFEILFDYNMLEKLFDYNLFEKLLDYSLFDYNFEKLLDYKLLEKLLGYNLFEKTVRKAVKLYSVRL